MKKISKKGRILTGLCFVAVIAVIVLIARSKGKQDNAPVGELWVPAQRGPLVISFEESGEIKPREQLTLKSEVEGRVSIIYIIPEGTNVKKGDLLVELDVADKIDQKVNQEIEVENANAEFILRTEELEIAKNQALTDVELAEQELEFAEEDLIKYKEGEYPNKLSETYGNLALSEQEVERAKEKYEWSKKLYEEKFLSESELKSDELSWKHSQLSLQTSQGNLKLLENYTHKRELAKLESAVRQKKAALDRTRRKAKSSVIQAESSLRARESALNRQRQKLAKINEQIEKSKIYAPQNGQVIYSTSTGRPWERNEPLKEGVEVWQRRDLIYLPTSDSFIASSKAHESYLKSISTGMPVRVRCDALPTTLFNGTLTKISPLADTSRRWLNPDLKEYPTEVLLDTESDELRSGMSCRMEIIIAQYEDALSVPVQCVVPIGEKSYVWIKGEKGEAVRREVKTGMDNNRQIHILSGLEGTEEVLLTPPLQESVREKQPLDGKGPKPPAPGASNG